MRRSVGEWSDLEANPPVELEARAIMTTAKMRGEILANIGEAAVMSRDAISPKRRNGAFGDVRERSICGTDLRSGSQQGVVR